MDRFSEDWRLPHTLDGATQTVTAGPMASQEIVKLRGGGSGFMAAKSASANENPTPFSNFLECSRCF